MRSRCVGEQGITPLQTPALETNTSKLARPFYHLVDDPEITLTSASDYDSMGILRLHMAWETVGTNGSSSTSSWIETSTRGFVSAGLLDYYAEAFGCKYLEYNQSLPWA